jgi:hypothetical protein
MLSSRQRCSGLMNQHAASPAAIGQFGDRGRVERIAKESGQHSELTAARMRRERRIMAGIRRVDIAGARYGGPVSAGRAA